MLEDQTFLAPLLPFWEKRCTEPVEVGLGDEGIHWEYAFALGLVIVQPNPRSQRWVDPQAGITHPGSCARNLSQIILANRVESSYFQEMFTLVSTPSFVIYFSEETKKAHQ
jgi:hypothetical protein